MSDIVVVSTALNAAAYAARCVRSVREQTVDARHVYVDAASDDETAIEARLAGGPSTFVIPSEDRLSVIANLRDVIRRLPRDSIVCWLDGDDWLSHPRALERVAREYEDSEVWLTYGQFEWPDKRIGFAGAYDAAVHADNAYRRAPWLATHLKTFRAGLFMSIPADMLRDESGRDYELSVDQAVMLPMLEMAGEAHQRFIPDVLVHYNYDHAWERTARSEDRDRELAACRSIRSKRPLLPIDRPW